MREKQMAVLRLMRKSPVDKGILAAWLRDFNFGRRCCIVGSFDELPCLRVCEVCMRLGFGCELNKKLIAFGVVVVLGTGARVVQAQDDANTAATDGGGQEILQSVFVPLLANAPFSLTLATEWTRPMNNGGTYTVVNSRPIKRDSVGRLYEERWLLSPKGSNLPSQMSWIQIGDPTTKTLCQCNVRQKVCELLTLSSFAVNGRFDPTRLKTAPLKDGKGIYTHEDLGAGFLAGLPVHEYRDTTTLNSGVMGNDLPMSTVRLYRFSAELGINLSSVLDTPQLGRQMFTVTEISTTEPDASFFQPPHGYKVVDHRKTAAPAN